MVMAGAMMAIAILSMSVIVAMEVVIIRAIV